MAVLTGRSGQLYVDGVRVSKVTGWSLDEQRPMLESTPVDVWDRTVVPGRRSGTGSAKLLYDPEDAAAGVFFDSILLNTKTELGVTLMLDSLTGESYPVTVHVSGASHAVARGEAQMRDISFKLSDTSISLEIIGSTQVGKAAIGLYTGAIYGLDGAWTFLWTSSGPTIANPTDQSTDITFDALGTFTITLTATLGTTVLTDTHVVEVIDLPLMWITRMTSPTNGIQGSNPYHGATAMDTINQEVYYGAAFRPDISLGNPRVVLSKFDYAGNRLLTKALNSTASSPGVSFIQVLDDGTVFVVLTSTFNEPQMLRLSADMSTIIWQVRYTSTTRWGGGVYDSATNRVYFTFTYATNPFFVAYIDLATGAVTKVIVTPSPAPLSFATSITPVVTSAGTVLFGFTGDRAILLEFNKDFKVGAVYTAIRVTEYQGISSAQNSGILLETDNYYALAAVQYSGQDRVGITLFNKSDLSFVTGNVFGSQGTIQITFVAGLGGAYYANGEITLWSGQYFTPGISVAKISEDLASVSSAHKISASTSTVYGAGALGFSPVVNGYGSNCPAKADPSTGLITCAANAGPGSEYCVLFRSTYGASYAVQYSTTPVRYLLNSNPLRPPGAGFIGAPSAPTATFNRTYTYALEAAPATATSTVTIENETLITFDEYVLAAP